MGSLNLVPEAQYILVCCLENGDDLHPISHIGKEPIRLGCGKIRTYLGEIS